MNLLRIKLSAVALAALALSACSGGGGPTQSASVSGSLQPPVPPRNPADYGIFAAPGVNLLPIRSIRATNSQLAEMVGIAEYASPSDLHSIQVGSVACHSFVKACANPAAPLAGSLPFTLYNLRETDDPEGNSVALTRYLLDQIPETTKVVSVSIEPNVLAMIEQYGANLPFAVVQSSGNVPSPREDPRDLFFRSRVEDSDTGEEISTGIIYDADTGIASLETGGPVLPIQQRMIRRMISAIEADKVLYVSGYRRRFGGIERHPRAVDCIGVESGCIYAQFEYRLPGSSASITGTSFGAPNVAMALASVLAYFPDTSGEDLIRLAKTCADPQPGLAGLGVANFTCMTQLDARGEWRLVSDAGFEQLTSPASMRQLGFPGNAEVAGNFETGREGTRTVRLAALSPSLFHATDFSAGVPKDAYSGEKGLFPIASAGGGATSVGSGIGFEGGFFAAAAYGNSNNFYGLGSEFGYGASSKLDISLGHDALYLRATYSESEGSGDLLSYAHGTAFGISARQRFQLTPGVRLDASLHADRFAGGAAHTAFGKIDIEQSPWNRHADLTMRLESESGATYLIGGQVGQDGSGKPQRKLTAGFNYSF